MRPPKCQNVLIVQHSNRKQLQNGLNGSYGTMLSKIGTPN